MMTETTATKRKVGNADWEAGHQDAWHRQPLDPAGPDSRKADYLEGYAQGLRDGLRADAAAALRSAGLID